MIFVSAFMEQKKFQQDIFEQKKNQTLFFFKLVSG